MKREISILIPLYYNNFIESTLWSIEEQTFRDFEVVIVDGQSDPEKSETETKIMKLVEELSFGVTYEWYEKSNTPQALNRAFSLSKGRFITFCAHDDRLLPDALENRYNEIIASEGDVIYTCAYIIDENGYRIYNQYHIAPKFDLERFKQVDFINSGTLLIKREKLLEVGGWSEQFKNYAEDWDLLLKLAYSGCKFVNSSEFTYEYRIHPGQATNRAKRDELNNMVLERVRSGYYDQFRD